MEQRVLELVYLELVTKTTFKINSNKIHIRCFQPLIHLSLWDSSGTLGLQNIKLCYLKLKKRLR